MLPGTKSLHNFLGILSCSEVLGEEMKSALQQQQGRQPLWSKSRFSANIQTAILLQDPSPDVTLTGRLDL